MSEIMRERVSIPFIMEVNEKLIYSINLNTNFSIVHD